MAMHGSLQDMGVADLIQHNCQDRKTARLLIEQNGQTATLYFNEGAVQHAALDELEGEEVVYKILSWHEGKFTLEMGEPPPGINIERSWSGLLLEGAKRLDESSLSPMDDLLDSPPPDESSAPKKSDILAETLIDLLGESSDIHGAAIVGIDGLVYSANVPQNILDESLVGASSAAIFGLSRRSVDQLKRGNFRQTLIQGNDGNIIVASLSDETLFIGLTDNDVNLGLAFSEVRSMVSELRSVL